MFFLNLEDAVLTILRNFFAQNVYFVPPGVQKRWKKKFFIVESNSFKKFVCTLRIQFCQTCWKRFARVLIMFQLMSKTDRVFFSAKNLQDVPLDTKNAVLTNLLIFFEEKAEKCFVKKTKMTWKILFFWKKDFPGPVECSFD